MKNILILFLFLVGFTAFAQTPESLQSATKRLYVAFDEIDIDLLSQMICSAEENQMVYDQLDAYFLNDISKFRFVNTNAKITYSPIKVIDGKSYASIHFRNVIRITYFKPMQSVADTQQELKAKFKAQSVVYEKSRNSFMIVYTANLMAISETENPQWSFTFTDNTLPMNLSETCLAHSKIIKELGLN